MGRNKIPFPNDKNAPVVITNQAYDEVKIKDILLGTEFLGNQYLDTLIVIVPFISKYFVKVLAETNVKCLVLVINSDTYNPDYVNNAVKLLKYVKYKVIVRKRKKGTRFMHMKVMVPYLNLSGNIVDFCIITGSVNFTKQGITISDEMLIILRDPWSIAQVQETVGELMRNTEIEFESSNYIQK